MRGPVNPDREGIILPGQDLVITGRIGLYGAGLIVAQKEEQLRTRFGGPFLKRILKLRQDSQPGQRVMERGSVTGNVTADCPFGEGGVLAALWQAAGDYGVGLRFELRKIPVDQEVLELCECFGLNPYRLWSEHCFVLAADHGWDAVNGLKKQQIPAAVIGKFTAALSCEIVHGEEVGYLERPAADEVWKIIK